MRLDLLVCRLLLPEALGLLGPFRLSGPENLSFSFCDWPLGPFEVHDKTSQSQRAFEEAVGGHVTWGVTLICSMNGFASGRRVDLSAEVDSGNRKNNKHGILRNEGEKFVPGEML